ncbi:MAG: signal peptide peptidase SppA [Nitriliruptorales bacterium]
MSRKRLIGLIAIGVLLVAAVAVVLIPQDDEDLGGDAVAVIHLSGPIQETRSAGLLATGAISPDLVRDRLERAIDAGVAAVVVRVASPGGSVAASQEIAGMFADAEVPIVVSMGDVAASGGYYIAAAADHIVAQPGTLTGSIGVIWALVDPSELLERLGVELEVITAGELKDLTVPGRLTPEGQEVIQTLVDEFYDQFVNAVAEGRELSRDEVLDLATGELFAGTQALEHGLVDELGGLDTAIAAAERLAGIGDAEIVEFEPSFFDLLFGPGFRAEGGSGGLLGGSAGPYTEVELLRALLEGWFLIPRY